MTPSRNIRIDDETWDSLREAADETDTTASAVIKGLIKNYLREHQRWVDLQKALSDD